MRVFIGIALSDMAKESLFDLQKQLKIHSKSGNYTDKDNFHLTLQFIGEVTSAQLKRIESVVSAVAVSATQFEIPVNYLGEFKQKTKSIVWAGTDETVELGELYDILQAVFAEMNIVIVKKDFTPHITLGRKLLLKEQLEQVQKELTWRAIPITVDNVTLFESVRIHDKLVYRPIKQQRLSV